MAKALEKFLTKATYELLYNIVSDEYAVKIGYRELSEKFEEATGFRPMDFFGIRNFTRLGWFEFLRKASFFIVYNGFISVDDEYETGFDMYDPTLADYREELLIKACKLIAVDDFGNYIWSRDPCGNSPLHLIAAMPGAVSESRLFEYLLESGIDPLQKNNEGMNFLHIIAGRMKLVASDENDGLHFKNERLSPKLWKTNHIKEFLDNIFGRLGQSTLSTLATARGRNGNTVIHEWVLSIIDLSDVEVKAEMEMIGPILLEFGGKLDIPNQNGHYPLHFAFNSTVCKFLLENGVVTTIYKDSATRQISQLVEATTALTVSQRKRKLRSCPKYHSKIARQLRKAQENVAVVGKYRYFTHMSIGSGAFSSIYVAIKDEHCDDRAGTIDCRAFALKRLEKAKIDPNEIKREVQALLSISTKCENIVNCYESFDDEFFHYLSLDLMDGDLQHFIENTEAKKLMRHPGAPAKAVHEIVNGLVFLHKRDYLHRDLKPGNILYTVEPSLHFKISDFGLAKNVSSLSMMTSTNATGGAAMLPGTRCWMAPELVSLRSRDHTKESDVFALGLVLHFLLTSGKHPFSSTGEEPAYVVEKKIVDMDISIDSSLNIEASSFIQIILNKDPKRRPPVQYLVQHPFLWSGKKKIEFLKAVGDQPEAVTPSKYPNSSLEKVLQKTDLGQQFKSTPWWYFFEELYLECTSSWKQKKYRKDSVIDLMRFIRNAYAHKEERSEEIKSELENNLILEELPSLVLNVLGAVQKGGFDEDRSNIREVLEQK